ncbi:WD40-repeat-containing domain protein, partial [Jimgerdemannia flammicorona]
MGKKPIFKPNPNTAVPPRPVDALLSAFDPRADHFAIVTQAVDRHHLRIFDTHTATVKCDFSLEKEKFTCLTWGVMQAEREFGGPKKRRSTTSNPTTQVLALGLHNGSVAIYSLAQGSVVKTLSGSHTAPINDFVFTNDGCRGYSVAEDHHVVEWDVEEGREISNWKADIKSIKKIALSYGETKLLAAGHTIKMWDLDTRTVVKKFTGHASAITSIVFSANDTICASTAEHDRYINIWDCTLSSTNDTEFGNLTALILDTDVTHLAINSSNTILAIAEDGSMGLWQNANSPTSATAQAKNPPAKKRRSTTRPSDAVVRIVSTVDGRTVVPILKAAFVGGDESGTVLIARGSTVKPVFEKVV